MIDRMRSVPDDRNAVKTIGPKTSERGSLSRPAPSRTAGRSARDWVADGSPSDLPAWVAEVLRESRASVAHRMVRVPDVATLPAAVMEEAVREAYRELLDGLAPSELLRAWNFIPRINDPASREQIGSGSDRDRYMVFNAGRFRGFEDVMGSPVRYPVASGVGHAGDDLIVHLLHGAGEPRLVDNPRQVPPDAYSRRYGDPPPVFARAAVVRWPGREALLISGTASVVGEESAHEDAFGAQLQETMRNLEVLVERGWPGARLADLQDWLVYLPDDRHESLVRRTIGDRPEVVVRRQRLCRPELLVEIECAGFRPLDGDPA